MHSRRNQAVWLLVPLTFYGCHWAAADHAMGVSPTRIQVPVSAGTAVSGEVQVVNDGTGPFIVESSVTSWTVNESGERVWQDLTPEQRGGNLWVSLAPAKLRLTPGEQSTVKYTATIPANAYGGYRAMLVFKMVPEAGPPPQGPTGEARGGEATVAPMVAVVGRVGVPLYLDVEGPAGQIEVKGSLLQTEVLPPKGQDPIHVALHFANQGNTHINVSGSVVIMDAQGKPIGGSLRVDERTLIPGFTTVIKTPFQGELPVGRYGLLVTLEHGYKEQTKLTVAESSFEVFARAEVRPTQIKTDRQGGSVILPTVSNSGFVPLMVAGQAVIAGTAARPQTFRLPALAVPAGTARSASLDVKRLPEQGSALVLSHFTWAMLTEPSPEPPPLQLTRFSEDGEGRPVVALNNTGQTPLRAKGLWQWLSLQATQTEAPSEELGPLEIPAGQTLAVTGPVRLATPGQRGAWALSLMVEPLRGEP